MAKGSRGGKRAKEFLTLNTMALALLMKKGTQIII